MADNATIPECVRRGAEVRPGFYECKSNRLIHPEPGVVAINTCLICPYVNLQDRDTSQDGKPDPRFSTACVHRGEILERGVCTVCGMKGQPFDVFTCELHGKCMVRRYRNDRPDLRVCVSCDDFRACRDAVLPLNAQARPAHAWPTSV